MKRFLMLVGVAVVAAAMYVAASPASQQSRGPTAKQFKALKKQVAALSKKVKTAEGEAGLALSVLVACDQGAVPIGQFGDAQNGTEGYYYKVSATQDTVTTALDVADPSANANVPYITIGDKSCAQLFSGQLRHAAAKAGIRLPHASLPSWSAHQR